jgi:hypothetical protein
VSPRVEVDAQTLWLFLRALQHVRLADPGLRLEQVAKNRYALFVDLFDAREQTAQGSDYLLLHPAMLLAPSARCCFNHRLKASRGS